MKSAGKLGKMGDMVPEEARDWMRKIGSLGGLARKASLSPERLTEISLVANQARQKALSRKRRSEIARHAALVRWGKKGQI